MKWGMGGKETDREKKVKLIKSCRDRANVEESGHDRKTFIALNLLPWNTKGNVLQNLCTPCEHTIKVWSNVRVSK